MIRFEEFLGMGEKMERLAFFGTWNAKASGRISGLAGVRLGKFGRPWAPGGRSRDPLWMGPLPTPAKSCLRRAKKATNCSRSNF